MQTRSKQIQSIKAAVNLALMRIFYVRGRESLSIRIMDSI